MKAIATVASLLLALGLSPAHLKGQEETGEPSEGLALEEAVSVDKTESERQEPETAVVLMNPRWAELACEAWNRNPTLTDELAAPGWAANNEDRGYKVIQLYRTDCATSPWVELDIADQNGKALCVYGGPVKTEELISGVDYIMHAQTQRWQEMGAGDYGPMKGMITGRLKFTGPKWEAMKNMGPFSSFLQLTGEVPSDASACPREEPS